MRLLTRMAEARPMIQDVDLHDATLIAVRANWEDGLCGQVKLDTFNRS